MVNFFKKMLITNLNNQDNFKMKITNHKDRAIIEISGSERKKFLQGLMTNDINLISENNLIFSVMLNAKGRFLYDFFIFEDEEKIFLDCLKIRRDEIITKLGFYKLRSDVKIVKNDEILPIQILDFSKFPELKIEIQINNQKEAAKKDFSEEDFYKENLYKIFNDPRAEFLGKRAYLKKENSAEIPSEILNETANKIYEFIRIKNKICESEKDLTFEKSLILEFGFNEQNAINYEKGCYIGQELTARTHHTGEIRKEIIFVKINIDEKKSSEIEKNLEILSNNKKLGIILSSVNFNDNLYALALIKKGEEYLKENLLSKNYEIEILG
jgi:hypothetical protein